MSAAAENEPNNASDGQSVDSTLQSVPAVDPVPELLGDCPACPEPTPEQIAAALISMERWGIRIMSS
jgi:hypothetical protein